MTCHVSVCLQLTEVERSRSFLEVDNNGLKRRLAAMSVDTVQVKEQVGVTDSVTGHVTDSVTGQVYGHVTDNVTGHVY